MTERQPFYETDDERRWWLGLTGRALVIGAAVLVLVVVATAGTLLWRYYIAGPSGKVQKQQIIQSGVNQLTQQAQFETLYADIKRYDVQIGQTAASADPQRDTILLGLEQQCVDAVARYDALARTEQAQAFRAADLPAQIDTTDPTTDCKETK